MQKIIKLILTLFLACGLLYASPFDFGGEVQAVTSAYPLHCSTQYEVAIVNDSGGFDKVGCYSDFSTARKTMWNYGDDAVVRHHQSYSPTGIIAMNSGVAISYPKRSGSTTLTASAANGGGKTSYIVQHREMSDGRTESYNGNGTGQVYVMFNGFDGYVDLKNVDLVPMKYITDNIPITLGGNDITSSNEQPFTLTVKQSHYKVEQNGNYKDLVYYAYSGYNSTTYKSIVGPAADWMSVGSTYYSWDNHTFYTDRKYTNLAGTYYNYFQFLPVRSQSEIEVQVFNDFLASKGYNAHPSSSDFNSLKSNESKLWNEGQTFINSQNNYGVNALLIFAMACLESGYGRSRYAVERNNLFGWSAYDSDPDSATYFSSISQAITEHMGINIRGYADITDYRFFGSHVGNKGSGFNVKYASDPYWGTKIAAIAYEIDKFANGNDGTLTDWNNYSLGLITQEGTDVKKEPSSSSTTLYNTTYGNNYQRNFTVVIQSQDSNWTKLQSTNGLYDNGTLITHKTNGTVNGLIPYDFDRSVGYLPTSQIQNINDTTPEPPEGTVAVGDFKQSITSFNMTSATLTLFGYAYQPGIYISDLADVEHYLVLDNGSTKQEIELSEIIYEEANYKAAGFAGLSLDLTALAVGEYQLAIKTVHSAYTEEKAITGVTAITNEIGIKNYEITSNNQKTVLKISEDEVTIEQEYITGLSELSLSDEGVLSIYGRAYVTGLENSKETIAHKINIVDLKDNTLVRSVDLTSTTGDYDITLGYPQHGLDYSHAWYQGNFNIADLALGEYKLEIVTTIEGQEFKRILTGRDVTEDTAIVFVNDHYIQALKQNKFSNRFEIHVQNYQLDIEEKNTLPTYMEAYSYMMLERFNEETNTLTIKGTAYIQRGSFSEDDEVKYTLYMINKETQSLMSYESLGLIELSNNDFCWDNTENQTGSTKYNYDYTWYEFDIDLAGLDDGDYTFKLLIETKDYVELIDLKDNTSREYTNILNPLKVIGSRDTNNKYKVSYELGGFYDLKNE